MRIPADVVAKLGITADEEAEIRVTGKNSFEVVRDRSRQEAIEKLRKMRVEVPEDFVFNREELYDR